MKLNDKFLAVQYETENTLKDWFQRIHLDPQQRAQVEMQQFMAELSNEVYDKQAGNWWETRCEIAKSLVSTPKNMKRYYITKTVQQGAELIKYDKIDLKWFKNLPSMNCIYIPNKDEFFRFEVVENYRINILHYRRKSDVVVYGVPDVYYDSYSIILNEGVLAMMPSQDKAQGERFIKLLLFIEMGDITFQHLKAKTGKVVFGKGGDDKLKNESGYDVTVVNSNWNKIVIVEGGFTVRGHFRLQPCGVGRSQYKLTWVREYTKGTYVRNAGRLNQEKKT